MTEPTRTPGDPGDPGEPGDIWVQMFESRFGSLEESNRSLASDVRALTSTLKIVNDLQIEQREMARRNTERDHRVDSVEKDAAAKIARTRTALNLVGITLTVLLPLVSLVVYLSLIAHVNDLLNQQGRDRLAACLQRNSGTAAEVRREQQLADLQPAGSPERGIHQQSAQAIARTAINCQQIYKPVDK